MLDIDRIFVIIDPARERQVALQRAVRIAQVRNARIHAYACVFSGADHIEPEDLKAAELFRQRLWLERIIAPIRDQGIDVELELDWDQDWRAAICRAVRRTDCGLVLKHSRAAAGTRRLLPGCEAQLLQAARCPVMLVKQEDYHRKHIILMAGESSRDSDAYRQVLDAVLACGNTCVAAHEHSELHVVNCFTGSDDYVHVTDVVKRTGVPLNRVHVVSGEPEQAVARVAREIGAEAVIIGLSTRSSIARRFFGTTAEDLMQALEQDILVVTPPAGHRADELIAA